MPRFRQHADAVSRRTGFTAADTAAVLREHLTEVTDTLARGDRVVLTGFGTFRMIKGKPAFVPSDALVSALTQTE